MKKIRGRSRQATSRAFWHREADQALRETSPQALHHFTQTDQVNQLVRASEADPDLGFMARRGQLEGEREWSAGTPRIGEATRQAAERTPT